MRNEEEASLHNNIIEKYHDNGPSSIGESVDHNWSHLDDDEIFHDIDNCAQRHETPPIDDTPVCSRDNVDLTRSHDNAEPDHVPYKSCNLDEDAKHVANIISNYSYEDESLLSIGKVELSNKCQSDMINLPKYKSTDEKGKTRTKTFQRSWWGPIIWFTEQLRWSISFYDAKKRGKHDYMKYKCSYAELAIAGHIIIRRDFATMIT